MILMASEKEANLAREQYSDFLKRLGAHSIGVDRLKGKDETGFAVIAFFARKPAKTFPQTLEIESGQKTIAVPLMAETMKRPTPEKPQAAKK